MGFDGEKIATHLVDEFLDGPLTVREADEAIHGGGELKEAASSGLRPVESGSDDRDLLLGHAALSSWHPSGEEERRTLLVVDNDQFDREYLATRLGQLFPDFDIQEAEDAFGAIKMLRDGLFTQLAKVFTDNNMPGMKGVDLARVMRGEKMYGVELARHKIEALKRVPVSLVTGDRDLREASQLVDRGILDHVIKKPVNPLDISRGVEMAVIRNMGLRVGLSAI